MPSELWHLGQHMNGDASRALQAKGRVAGLREPVLCGSKEVAILSVEKHQSPLGEVQQGANSGGHIHNKNVSLHTVVEQLEPGAVVVHITTRLRNHKIASIGQQHRATYNGIILGSINVLQCTTNS